ncbi:AAA family ATPase [Streptomyces sp. NPDC000878]
MTPGREQHGLLSRGEEKDRLLLLLSDARQGRSGLLVLRGEPGIGKTALLEEAVTEAVTVGMRVLRATGIEMEAELAFAGLSELIRPVQGLVGGLPEVQARALRVALSLEDGKAPDRLTLGAAVVTLLTDAAAAAPVLVAVDDAHWMDETSAQALLFAFRRMQAEGVAVLVTARDAERCAFTEANANLPTLRLTGLTPADAAALVKRSVHAAVDPETIGKLYRETAGNPLALLEAAPTLRASRWVTQEPESPLPVGPRLTAAYASRLAALPEPGRRAVTVAAAGFTEEADVLIRALDALALDAAILRTLESAGMVSLAGNAFRFAHPLLRAAAYHGATPQLRREAHRALAGALSERDGPVDRDQRSWHLAAAADGPDAAAATALTETAARARARGALPAALRAYERAAELTSSPTAQGRCLLAAAEVAQLVGRGDEALRLAGAASDATDDVAVFNGALGLRSQVLLLRRQPREVHDELADAAEGLDPAAAVPLLVAAAGAACMGGAVLQARATADRACAAAGHHRNGDLGRSAVVLRAHTMMLVGERGDAAAVLRSCEGFLTGMDPLSIGIEVTSFSAMDLMWLERFPAARTLLERAVRRARKFGAFERLAPFLTVLAETQMRTGYWDEACALASEGVMFAEETEQPVLQAYALSVLARIEAARGQSAQCVEHAHRFRLLLDGTGAELVSPYIEAALGLLELGTGKAAEAAARLTDLQQRVLRSGLAEPTVLQHQPDLVEAALAAGDPSAAQAASAELLRQVRQAPSVWGQTVSERCQGLVRADEDALRRATAHHERLPDPFAKARTDLAYGRLLLRTRRRGAARRPLLAARQVFERLRADPWTTAAEEELRAAGARTPARHGRATAPLTERETQVAVLVSKGHTTPEVAAALFLSPKTVEYHLSRIFAKLSVRSRTELASRLSTFPQGDFS